MIIAHPNQKIVTVHKAPADKNNIYGVMNKLVTFRNVCGLTGNEIKAYVYLSLNQDGYSMALSTEDMATQMGSSPQCMRTAIKGLIKKGYLVKKKGNFYDFVEDPLDATQEAKNQTDCNDDVKTHKNVTVTDRKTNGYHDENKGEIIKEEYSESTVNYNTGEGNLSKPKADSKEWDEIFGRIKVRYYPHTMKRLQEAAGSELDARVVRKIVNDKWSAFENKMFEKEGYRLNTLANLLKENYSKYKYVLAAQDAEYKRAIEKWRNQPRIDYDMLCWRAPKKPEGLDDISAFLEECWGNADDTV